MVMRLLLTPGHIANACATPMMNAFFNVMSAIFRVPYAGFHHKRKMPPTAQAATIAHGVNNLSLMLSPKATPMTAAGRNAHPSMVKMLRPSASLPITPLAMLAMRTRYKATTAKIAPS